MFKCDKCGICCRHILKNAEELDRGDGICKNLDEKTNLCMIYEERPIFCNVDRYYNLFLVDRISLKEYYDINYQACSNLKERYGK